MPDPYVSNVVVFARGLRTCRLVAVKVLTCRVENLKVYRIVICGDVVDIAEAPYAGDFELRLWEVRVR